MPSGRLRHVPLRQVVNYYNILTRSKTWHCSLGVVHNCQHLCIRTERTDGTMPAYYFEMLIFC